MSTLELKELLKSKIDQTEDNNFLNEMNIIFTNHTNLIDDYNIDLQKSENDIIEGNVFSHNEVLVKIEEWKKR
jgi:hypothetical protein